MEEHNIRFLERTFEELEKEILLDVKDPHFIMSSLGPKMREALLHNPSGYKKDEICQILAINGDTVVGCTNSFSGRLLLNGMEISCQSGSYLYSHPEFRKDNVGGEIFYRQTNHSLTKNCCFAGISQMALPLYYALKYTVFQFPRLIYLRHSKSVIQNILNSEEWWTKPLIWMVDTMLGLHRGILNICNKLFYRRYTIEEVKECPIEIEQIVRQDKHKYMELHDKAWFDWILNYSFSEDFRNVRRLFIIKLKGRIEAFILIKQEFFEQASTRGFKNVYLGSVMEWGIANSSKLREYDIARISLMLFDNNIDGIQYATTDRKVVNKLNRCMFVGVGKANIGLRIKMFKEVDLKDINNWRIRLAASDTVLN